MHGGTITAMTTALILLAVIAFAALVLYTARVVRNDDFGSRRRPPASHQADVFDPSRRFARAA
jgi:hypothetical protein